MCVCVSESATWYIYDNWTEKAEWASTFCRQYIKIFKSKASLGKNAVIKASQKETEYKVEKLFDLFELFYVCCAIHGTVKLGYITNNYIV